jgi:hypothetical protein
MARPDNVNNDPRWEGLDSMSLPNRPAHPDPSRRFEATDDPDNAPIHGIRGFVEAKHGIASEAEVKANDYALAQAQLDSLRDSEDALKGRDDDESKAQLASVRKQIKDMEKVDMPEADELSGGAGVRAAVLSGEAEVDVPVGQPVPGLAETGKTEQTSRPDGGVK